MKILVFRNDDNVCLCLMDDSGGSDAVCGSDDDETESQRGRRGDVRGRTAL